LSWAADAKVTRLFIGRMSANVGKWYGLPEGHRYAGRVELPMYCYHVALPGRSVLVDAMAYEFPDDKAEYRVAGSNSASLLEQLAKIGAPPESITDVIITHNHFDHYNGLSVPNGGGFAPAFPNARHYLGAADWEPEDFEPLEENTLGLVYEKGLLELVGGEKDLGDGLKLIPAPGETPGHQMLHVIHADGEAYFAGDLYHHPLELEETKRDVYWADEEMMRASKQSLLKNASASAAVVHLTHFAQPQRITKDGSKYIWLAAKG
jgi:glyoxylase-like metal-dependent hydrolase (beta-lactamase superfamily II)